MPAPSLVVPPGQVHGLGMAAPFDGGVGGTGPGPSARAKGDAAASRTIAKSTCVFFIVSLAQDCKMMRARRRAGVHPKGFVLGLRTTTIAAANVHPFSANIRRPARHANMPRLGNEPLRCPPSPRRRAHDENRPSRDESITQFPDGDDVTRRLPIIIQPASKKRDMRIDRARGNERIIAPDFAQ